MDDDIFLIEIGPQGRDSAPAPIDWATTKARVTALETTVGTGLSLSGLTDVSGTPDDGDILVYDDTSGMWLVQAPGAPLSVADTGSIDLTLTGTTLQAAVKYAGTGVASTASRSDHRHNTHSRDVIPFGPGGYLSSGSRTLATFSPVLASGIGWYVKATLSMQVRGADPGACYYTVSLSVNGNTRTSPGGTNGFWCVQGVPRQQMWTHTQPIEGDGTAVTITASIAYHSGGGFYTDAGELEIELGPNR